MPQILIVQQVDSGYTTVHIVGPNVPAAQRLMIDASHTLNTFDRIAADRKLRACVRPDDECMSPDDED
jgi:hypothetical protein